MSLPTSIASSPDIEQKTDKEPLDMSAFMDELQESIDDEAEEEEEISTTTLSHINNKYSIIRREDNSEFEIENVLQFPIATISQTELSERKKVFQRDIKIKHAIRFSKKGLHVAKERLFREASSLERKMRSMKKLADEMRESYFQYELYREFVETMERKLRDVFGNIDELDDDISTTEDELADKKQKKREIKENARRAVIGH